MSQKWFITLGYTIELVPLLVKIGAINRVMAATRRRKQIRIDIRSLLLKVAGIIHLVVAYLTTWTVVDPAERHEGRYLNEHGDVTEVATTVVCASRSTWWDVGVLCEWSLGSMRHRFGILVTGHTGRSERFQVLGHDDLFSFPVRCPSRNILPSRTEI